LLFSLLFLFFRFFFALNFSLRFDLVIFASKQNEGENFFASKEAKFNIFCIISLANLFQVKKKTFVLIYSLNFCFALIFLLNFRLFYLRFCFRFLVFRIKVNHVKSGFFFTSKRNKIFTSISNFASEVKVRAHPRWEWLFKLFLPATAAATGGGRNRQSLAL
jgi:hypothetical protein